MSAMTELARPRSHPRKGLCLGAAGARSRIGCCSFRSSCCRRPATTSAIPSSASRARRKTISSWETVRTIHLYAAIVFTLAVLVRFYWLFAGNSYARLTDFIPLSRRPPAQPLENAEVLFLHQSRSRRIRRPQRAGADRPMR